MNFAQNELEQIETGAFDNLKELRALRLDHNYLADINGLVSGKVIYNQVNYIDILQLFIT